MRFSALFFSFFICFIISCQKKTIPVGTVKNSNAKVKNEKGKIFPDANKFTIFLSNNIDDALTGNQIIPLAIGKEIIFLDSLTINVYKANNYKAFWNDSAKCHHIIRILGDSRFDGLIPKDYDIPSLDNMFKACFMGKKNRNDTLYWKLELAVTKNYLLYLNHLHVGKTNPEDIFTDWDYKRDPDLPYTSVEFSKRLSQNPETVLKEFRPKYPMYNLLRSLLYKFDSIGQNKSFEWDAIPYLGKDLMLGDTSRVIIQVKNRLLSLGFSYEDNVTNIFDDDLLTALNYYQQHAGLTPNGKIDKTTIYKLNFTLQELVDQVRVNMERCRWLTLKGDFPDYYIIVNIADYNLRIYKNDKLVYKTKVVVGSSNKETPSFHSQMATVEFNPYWTVPVSITGNEILPKLKTNPDYLTRNNMELLRGDSVIHITDFSSYSRNYCPFVIRQKPGVDNSLGLVKFLFPNPYSVYFHDTPSKSLFDKDVRAFSHGCVRVHKPMDLAAFLLSEQGMTPKDISEIVKTGKNTPIALKNKIPVMITYWTCSTDQNNKVFFFKDIYGRDKLILKELNKPENLFLGNSEIQP
jgi:L,D-transpeptidase YcbB